jgi:hypothetical protein
LVTFSLLNILKHFIYDLNFLSLVTKTMNLYLGEQDFYVDKGTKGNVICCTQKGVLFVMFQADPGVCQYCELAKPEFMQLPQIIGGAKFALCNLSKCPNLVQLSYQTITPLNKVPLFILFVNGRPFMNYSGEKQIKHFAEFMQNVLQRLSQQSGLQNISGGAAGGNNLESERTAYGIPYDFDYEEVNSTNVGINCENGVCYITSKDAYGTTEGKHPMSNTQMGPAGARQQPQQPQQQQMMYPPQQQQQMMYPPQQQQQMMYQPQQQQRMYQPPQQSPAMPYQPQQQRMAQPYVPRQAYMPRQPPAQMQPAQMQPAQMYGYGQR